MKIHKSEIAKRQIDTAIDLLLEGKEYFSVITLAGAGEELIGNLLERNQDMNARKHLIDLDKRLSNGGRESKVVNQEINGFKNSLKHAKLPDEDFIDDAETHGHALAMLSRALFNYFTYNKEW